MKVKERVRVRDSSAGWAPVERESSVVFSHSIASVSAARMVRQGTSAHPQVSASDGRMLDT